MAAGVPAGIASVEGAVLVGLARLPVRTRAWERRRAAGASGGKRVAAFCVIESHWGLAEDILGRLEAVAVLLLLFLQRTEIISH